MEYPNENARVAMLLAGFDEAEDRRAKIEERVRAGITQLPSEARAYVTPTMIFAGSVDSRAVSQALRDMMRNPAFKVEAVISQLRRAEANFIESHDAYVAHPDIPQRALEMEWSTLRVRIVHRFYEAMVASLPTRERPAAAARRVVRESVAVETLAFADLSSEEQDALAAMLTDRAAAVTSIDAIIAAGRASGRNLPLILSYIIDPERVEEVERWITAGLAAREAEQVLPGPVAMINQASGDREPAGRPIASTAPTAGAQAEADPDEPARHAISILEAWLDRSSWAIARFEKIDGIWRFGETFRSAAYASAYAVAVDHPAFQRMIEERKAGTSIRPAV